MSNIDYVLYELSIYKPDLYEGIAHYLSLNKRITLMIIIYKQCKNKEYKIKIKNNKIDQDCNKFKFIVGCDSYIFNYQLVKNTIKEYRSRDICSLYNNNKDYYQELLQKEWIYQIYKLGIDLHAYFLTKLVEDIWTIEEFENLIPLINNTKYTRCYVKRDTLSKKAKCNLLMNIARTYYTQYGDFLQRYLYLAKMKQSIYLIDYDINQDLSIYILKQGDHWLIKPTYIIDMGKYKNKNKYLYDEDKLYKAFYLDDLVNLNVDISNDNSYDESTDIKILTKKILGYKEDNNLPCNDRCRIRVKYNNLCNDDTLPINNKYDGLRVNYNDDMTKVDNNYYYSDVDNNINANYVGDNLCSIETNDDIPCGIGKEFTDNLCNDDTLPCNDKYDGLRVNYNDDMTRVDNNYYYSDVNNYVDDNFCSIESNDDIPCSIGKFFTDNLCNDDIPCSMGKEFADLSNDEKKIKDNLSEYLVYSDCSSDDLSSSSDINIMSEWYENPINNNDDKIITILRDCGYYNLPIVKFKGFPLIVTNELFNSKEEAINYLKTVVNIYYVTPISLLDIPNAILEFKYRPNSNLREVSSYTKEAFKLQFHDYSK